MLPSTVKSLHYSPFSCCEFAVTADEMLYFCRLPLKEAWNSMLKSQSLLKVVMDI